MRHPAEREQLLTIIADLLRFQLLDPPGGAFSLRLSTGDILLSATGSAFRRWNITPDDFILLTPDGAIIERTGGLGASGTPIHLAIYQTFPGCNAIIHAHAPYSLAFASAGLDLPSCTNQADTPSAASFTCTEPSPSSVTPTKPSTTSNASKTTPAPPSTGPPLTTPHHP